MDFTRALLEGPLACDLRLDAAHGNGTDDRPLHLAGGGHARRMVVNWTYADRAGAGSAPNDPDKSLVAVSLGPPRTGEQEYTDVPWRIEASDDDGDWLLDGVDGHVQAHVRTVGSTSVRPSPGETWTGGAGAGISGGNPNASFTVVRPVASGLPILEPNATVAIEANGVFTIILWGIDLTVGSHTYHSGVWPTMVAGSALGPRGAARIDRTQVVRVHIDGDVSLTSEGSDTAWTGPQASLAFAGHETLEGATGTLRAGDGLLGYDNASVAVDGRTDLEVAPGPATVQLAARILPSSQAQVRTVRGPPRPALVRPADPTSPVGVAFSLAPLVALATAATATFWRGHRARNALPRAERELLAGRSRRGMRLLRVRLGADPVDVEAWFLYGAALLQADACEELARELAPVAWRTPQPARASLGFLLALAFARRGQRAPSWAWLQEALADPAFRRRAREESAFVLLRDEPGFAAVLRDRERSYA